VSHRAASATERLFIWLAGAAGPVAILLLGATWRVDVRGEEHVRELYASGRRAIFTFWHGRMLPLEYVARNRNIQVLSSLHRDGEISARLLRALGYGVVRGSSTRGSARGLVRLMARARQGLDLAITPDGPKGPPRKAKTGIFYLAERSGSAIVPIGVSAWPGSKLSSWDAFLLPAPFARVAVVYGAPLDWDAGASEDERSALLTEAIDALTDEADAIASGGRWEAECRTDSTEL
jgi:lysophospholipid acyltransferase (LPLAT)-like uncharacterized protein